MEIYLLILCFSFLLHFYFRWLYFKSVCFLNLNFLFNMYCWCFNYLFFWKISEVTVIFIFLIKSLFLCFFNEISKITSTLIIIFIYNFRFFCLLIFFILIFTVLIIFFLFYFIFLVKITPVIFLFQIIFILIFFFCFNFVLNFLMIRFTKIILIVYLLIIS